MHDLRLPCIMQIPQDKHVMAEADLLQLLSTLRVISQHTRPAVQLCLQVLNLLAACRQL